ncbi:MAG: hypothetical protein A2542_02155 [Parcubacteria group bacterium RIFOXYD2_FULL_52_8]|nr:MAG: hypothetical protein A2542_02155 [Parcubacteria group bacterium RIFOXYD2_FULL_52_8]
MDKHKEPKDIPEISPDMQDVPEKDRSITPKQPPLTPSVDKEEIVKKMDEVRESFKEPETSLVDIQDIIAMFQRMYERVNDIHSLPLSVDYEYKSFEENVTKHLESYGQALFAYARTVQGEERQRAAQALIQLSLFVKKEKYIELLGSLMTTKEAILELRRKGEEEQGIDPDHWWTKAKKIINFLRGK